MAENLGFLNLTRYLHRYFCLLEEKVLRSVLKFDRVRVLNRNHRFLFFILSLF